MSPPNEKLKKYITQCLDENLVVSKSVFDKAKAEYANAVLGGETYGTELELLFKRCKVAEIKYSEALVYSKQWQNQKQSLI